MSSALTGNKIKDSYQALLKMGTNGSLDPVTPIVISDGLGNDTPLLLSGTEFKTQVVSAAKLYGFWADLSSNSHVAVGDYAGQYNGTFLYVSDFNNVIQANSGGSVKGLSLDYSINNYIFGTSPNGMNVVDGVNKFLTINSNSFPFVDIDGTNNISQFGGQSAKLFSNGSTNFLSLGDYQGSFNGTTLEVDDLNALIQTKAGTIGFKLDFANRQYKFGDFSVISNGTSVVIDDNAKSITITADEDLAFVGAGLENAGAGGSSGKYLRILLNNNEYKIELLDP
jgi:hypothetical protein